MQTDLARTLSIDRRAQADPGTRLLIDLRVVQTFVHDTTIVDTCNAILLTHNTILGTGGFAGLAFRRFFLDGASAFIAAIVATADTAGTSR